MCIFMSYFNPENRLNVHFAKIKHIRVNIVQLTNQYLTYL